MTDKWRERLRQLPPNMRNSINALRITWGALDDEVAALEQKLEAYMEMARINTDFKLMALGCQEENSILEQRVKGLEPYAIHKGYCITRIKGGGHYQKMASCDCGLKEALANED